MGVEIEAKMKVPDLAPIRETLRRRGATGGKLTEETNVFFDDAVGKLHSGDQGLRLRTNREAASGHETHVITYKGPRQPGPLKSREEIEVAVDDPGAAAHLFEKLGYARILSFEKRRESWELDGCKVELDELPVFGTFVEVEGPGEREVLAVRAALGLAGLPMIKKGYANMVGEHLAREGKGVGDLRFA